MHLKPCSKPEFLCNTTGWANLARPVCVRVRDFQLAALDATQKPARLCFPLGQDFLQARICAVSPTFSVLVCLATMKNKPSRWNLCNNNQEVIYREVVFFWQARFRRNVVQTLYRSIFLSAAIIWLKNFEVQVSKLTFEIQHSDPRGIMQERCVHRLKNCIALHF